MPKKEILKKNLKSLTESKTQQLRSINSLSRQIMNLKTELVTDPSNPLKNNDLKYLTDTVGKLLKTFDGIDDERIEDEVVEEDENIVANNEGSEAHGKMPEEVMGENVVSISEKTLKNVIKRVVLEQTSVVKKMAEAIAKMKKDEEKVKEDIWRILKKFLSPKEVKEIDEKMKKELMKVLKSML
jgi:hypothetical protein